MLYTSDDGYYGTRPARGRIVDVLHVVLMCERVPVAYLNTRDDKSLNYVSPLEDFELFRLKIHEDDCLHVRLDRLLVVFDMYTGKWEPCYVLNRADKDDTLFTVQRMVAPLSAEGRAVMGSGKPETVIATDTARKLIAELVLGAIKAYRTQAADALEFEEGGFPHPELPDGLVEQIVAACLAGKA